MMEDETDYMTSFESANYLAAVIRQYWSRRGYSPEVYVEKMSSRESGVGVLYSVRSNMVNGMPVNG
jgi:hypothetical protein